MRRRVGSARARNARFDAMASQMISQSANRCQVTPFRVD
jgi:hypothetical protein